MTGQPASTVSSLTRAKLTGAARFVADVRSAPALHAAFTLSPYAHARIRSFDTSRARAVPGVATVLTGHDIGPLLVGRRVRDYPVLAVDRVLFVGQRVAVVAARDARTAQLAAELVEVDYEPLDPVLSVADALADGAPRLHPDQASYADADPQRPANVQGEMRRRAGGAAALADGDAVHEHRFAWPRTHAAPLETHGCLVVAGEDEVHVYSAHKEPNKLRRDLARLADPDEEAIHVHPVQIGGDFGAKGFPYVEGACYLVALATGRPIRCSLSYLEELTSTSARHPGTMTIRTALRAGRLHASVVETRLDGGAFTGLKPQAAQIVSVVGVPLAPYDVPNVDEHALSVYTNNLPGGQVRSPGEYQATFAGESHVDLIARSLGEAPIDFRRRHAAVEPAERVLEGLEQLCEQWVLPPTGGERGSTAWGLGVSIFHRASGAGSTTVAAVASSSGVRLRVSVPDQGAGSYDAFRNLAAGILSISVERVEVQPVGADTELIDAGSGASRVTSVVGSACAEACRNLLDELGRGSSASGRGADWILGRLDELGDRELVTHGHCSVEPGAAPRTSPAYGALALSVEVDVATGAFEVRRAGLVIDAGPIVNPVGHRGQLEGGFVYGLGQARFEELRTESGQVVSSTFGAYKLASASDVPPLEIRTLAPSATDGPETTQAFKAVGELANLGVAPALANAIDDAVGVRILDLPITAEKVWSGLRRG